MRIVVLILLSVILAYVAFGSDFGLKEGMGGFTKEFTLANLWPSQCTCGDGRPGTFALGGKGDCVCPSGKPAPVVTPQGTVAPPPGDYETTGLLWPL